MHLSLHWIENECVLACHQPKKCTPINLRGHGSWSYIFGIFFSFLMEQLSPQESAKLSPQESEKLSPQESEKLSPHADPPSIVNHVLPKRLPHVAVASQTDVLLGCQGKVQNVVCVCSLADVPVHEVVRVLTVDASVFVKSN